METFPPNAIALAGWNPSKVNADGSIGGWEILQSIAGTGLVTDSIYDYAPTYNDGTYKYYPKTYVLGSAVSAGVWQITRMRIADGQTSYAGSAGSFGKFDQVATQAGLAALTYSQT